MGTSLTITLNVALLFWSPFFSHAFCSEPSMVLAASVMAGRHPGGGGEVMYGRPVAPANDDRRGCGSVGAMSGSLLEGWKQAWNRAWGLVR